MKDKIKQARFFLNNIRRYMLNDGNIDNILDLLKRLEELEKKIKKVCILRNKL